MALPLWTCLILEAKQGWSQLLSGWRINITFLNRIYLSKWGFCEVEMGLAMAAGKLIHSGWSHFINLFTERQRNMACFFFLCWSWVTDILFLKKKCLWFPSRELFAKLGLCRVVLQWYWVFMLEVLRLGSHISLAESIGKLVKNYHYPI